MRFSGRRLSITALINKSIGTDEAPRNFSTASLKSKIFFEQFCTSSNDSPSALPALYLQFLRRMPQEYGFPQPKGNPVVGQHFLNAFVVPVFDVVLSRRLLCRVVFRALSIFAAQMSIPTCSITEEHYVYRYQSLWKLDLEVFIHDLSLFAIVDENFGLPWVLLLLFQLRLPHMPCSPALFHSLVDRLISDCHALQLVSEKALGELICFLDNLEFYVQGFSENKQHVLQRADVLFQFLLPAYIHHLSPFQDRDLSRCDFLSAFQRVLRSPLINCDLVPLPVRSQALTTFFGSLCAVKRLYDEGPRILSKCRLLLSKVDDGLTMKLETRLDISLFLSKFSALRPIFEFNKSVLQDVLRLCNRHHQSLPPQTVVEICETMLKEVKSVLIIGRNLSISPENFFSIETTGDLDLVMQILQFLKVCAHYQVSNYLCFALLTLCFNKMADRMWLNGPKIDVIRLPLVFSIVSSKFFDVLRHSACAEDLSQLPKSMHQPTDLRRSWLKDACSLARLAYASTPFTVLCLDLLESNLKMRNLENQIVLPENVYNTRKNFFTRCEVINPTGRETFVFDSNFNLPWPTDLQSVTALITSKQPLPNSSFTKTFPFFLSFFLRECLAAATARIIQTLNNILYDAPMPKQKNMRLNRVARRLFRSGCFVAIPSPLKGKTPRLALQLSALCNRSAYYGQPPKKLLEKLVSDIGEFGLAYQTVLSSLVREALCELKSSAPSPQHHWKKKSISNLMNCPIFDVVLDFGEIFHSNVSMQSRRGTE